MRAGVILSAGFAIAGAAACHRTAETPTAETPTAETPTAETPTAESRCPAPSGEFPPRACAIVRGRAVDRAGRPIASLGLRVDSLDRERGYAYASGSALTDDAGRFELVVMRINEFTPPTVPDTATVEIKALPGTRPTPGFSAATRAPVRIRFAPLGERVEPTVAGDVVFALP